MPAPGRYVCDDHGEAGTLDVVYDYDLVGSAIDPGTLAADRDLTMWRYLPLLPVEPDAEVPPLRIGGTPLIPARRIASGLGLSEVWIKDEGRQATASLKDRASTVAAVKAREEGATIITTSSTGNAAAALAGVCASMGQASIIFVPEKAPEAKVAQLLAYGATVVLVEGTYADAASLCMEAAAAHGWYNRTTGYNPYVGEGKKTVMLEIIEQLSWQAPDAVFVSVGDGSIIGGVHKGIRDAVALGWIDHTPRLFGIQAAGSDFMVEAFERGEDVATKPPKKASTVADSISADLPKDRVKAMAAVRDTGGMFLRISDQEILAAIPQLAALTGVFAEPAAAAAYGGLMKAVEGGYLAPDMRVVVISTGSGLKDIDSAMQGVQASGAAPIRVPPSLRDLNAKLRL